MEVLTLKQAGEQLALSLDRIRQLQVQAVETLTAAVGGPEEPDRADVREAVKEALRVLAAPGVT